mmetsp:Transcript_66446/g.138494  ORF Transcript_66446/g.138494 Transcript_66446/m.138494 type:complete len:91 (-) Transcript_66446:10-282(-)
MHACASTRPRHPQPGHQESAENNAYRRGETPAECLVLRPRLDSAIGQEDGIMSTGSCGCATKLVRQFDLFCTLGLELLGVLCGDSCTAVP